MKETPNGPFPDYVVERTETHQQYIDRIFGEWLDWVDQSEDFVRSNGGNG